MFTGYDWTHNSAVIGVVAEGSQEVRTWPINGALKPFSLAFNKETDIMLKNWQYVLIVKIPPFHSEPMITVHHIESRDVLFNPLDKEPGSQFQVSIT